MLVRQTFGESIKAKLDSVIMKMTGESGVMFKYSFAVDNREGVIFITAPETEVAVYFDEYILTAPSVNKVEGPKIKHAISTEIEMYKKYIDILTEIAFTINDFYKAQQFDSYKFVASA